MKKITLSLIFLMISMSIVYSLTVEYISPADEFYLIKGGVVMGDIIFEANASPIGATGIIINFSLYHNISGTWGVNYTNDTTATIATETNRIFPSSDTSIFSVDLSDGFVFNWNVYACDNISIFYNEDVSLDSDIYVIYDNYTNTTGDGYCVRNSSCLNAEIITAGRGQVINYPLSSLDGVDNTTGDWSANINTDCTLNGSSNGYFYCNQTRKTYNGTDGRISTIALITSSVKVNYTISSTCRFVGANRTVYVEDAPNVTLIAPSDNSYVDDGTILFNYNVTGDSDTYTCALYSNNTGNWTAESGGFTATNAANETTSKVISEANGVVWNIRCAESANSNIYGWATANFTVTVDETNPVITITSPVDNAYVNYVSSTDGYSATINLTVNNSNANSCILKIDGTVNSTESYTSGTHFDLNFNATDGVYEWNVICSDSSTRTTETANRTITIDTVYPGINKNINYTSITADCEGFTVEFNSSEEVNLTFKYGLTSMSQTYSSIETDYAINQTVTLTFSSSYETDFYANASSCDRAGNCNNTYAEMTIPSPIPLCTGWSLWSVYEVINLSDYRIASGADYVYFWNNTGQSWIYSVAAGSLNEGYSMGIGDVVQLYESTDTTYFRNNSGTPGYYINITGGHAYFGLYHAYTFGNITYNIFKNESGGNHTPSNIWTGGLDFADITYFSGFNNSNQLYIDAPYLWSWNNDTTLGPAYLNGIDTLWAYVDYNLSINFTPGGEIIGNWT